MSRILITGITGFIGSHLARRFLTEGSEVYGLVRMPLNKEYITDIADNLCFLPFDGSYESMERAVRDAKPDIVYHLAAYYTGAHGPEATPKLITSNIDLGACLLEAMAVCGASKLVCASSVMAYCGGGTYQPLNLYAATKQAFSDLLAYYIDAGYMQAATLVLSDTYGPGDHRPKVLNLIKKKIQLGEHMPLSDGGQDYDVVYIDDVVDALMLAAEQSGSYQVCAENPRMLRETVELMLRANDLDWTPGWGEQILSGRIMRKAVRIYPTVPEWRQRVSLAEGLRRFWDLP